MEISEKLNESLASIFMTEDSRLLYLKPAFSGRESEELYQKEEILHEILEYIDKLNIIKSLASRWHPPKRS